MPVLFQYALKHLRSHQVLLLGISIIEIHKAKGQDGEWCLKRTSCQRGGRSIAMRLVQSNRLIASRLAAVEIPSGACAEIWCAYRNDFKRGRLTRKLIGTQIKKLLRFDWRSYSDRLVEKRRRRDRCHRARTVIQETHNRNTVGTQKVEDINATKSSCRSAPNISTSAIQKNSQKL